jgi:ribonuclease P/MRP protein subunit POP5
MRPMPRKPSRYLLLKVETDDAIPEEAIHLSVRESVLTLFGETGLAEISPRLFDYDEKTLTGIVKCTRGSVDKLRAAIALISTCAGKPVSAYVQAASGTSKALQTRGQSRSRDT